MQSWTWRPRGDITPSPKDCFLPFCTSSFNLPEFGFCWVPWFLTTPSTLKKQNLYLQTLMLERAISGFNVVYTSWIRWHITGKRNVIYDGPYKGRGFVVLALQSREAGVLNPSEGCAMTQQSGLYFPSYLVLFIFMSLLNLCLSQLFAVHKFKFCNN